MGKEPSRMALRAVIYARYSSENQNEASIEDQVRLCRARIESERWVYHHAYTDRAMSGATALRAGYQALLEDARNGAFNVVVAEALDRLSRDQEDIAALFKRMRFLGVRIITLAEGEINELHVGLKGTMNALFLKDLAQKTHRGLEGRVRQGRSGGGHCYGYDVVKDRDPAGEPVRGGRTINPGEAEVVQRIFREFAAGRSPRTIAAALNAEHIPGPRAKTWSASTIHGNWRRGTGILNNELYIGRLVWNRQRFVKDPETGRRVAKPNASDNWVVKEVPALRIIPDELWAEVKGRQKHASRATRPGAGRQELWHARRPKHLFSGLIHCGACGGSMVLVGKTHYGCSNRVNRGTCTNRLTMRRDRLERTILAGLKDRLLTPELVAEFVREFEMEMRQRAAQASQRSARARADLEKVERQIHAMVEAVKEGLFHAAMTGELTHLEERRRILRAELEQQPAPGPTIHPNLAELYRRKVDALHESLAAPSRRSEAAEILRTLVTEIRLVPTEGKLQVDLYGELAAILNLTSQTAASKGGGRSTVLVAGAGFEPATFRL